MNYDNKEDCDWIIEATPGKNVHLSFLTFELEDEQECGYDFIEVSLVFLILILLIITIIGVTLLAVMKWTECWQSLDGKITSCETVIFDPNNWMVSGVFGV